MSPVSQKHQQKKWETTEKIYLIDIKVKNKHKFSLNNFTKNKANILKFQRDKQTQKPRRVVWFAIMQEREREHEVRANKNCYKFEL